MKKQDFTISILVEKTPAEAFNVIKDVRAWWAGAFEGAEIEGGAERLGDEFTYRYKDIHFTRQRLVEVVPDKRLVWLVTESTINFVKDVKEWDGTRLIFDLSRKDGKTLVRFTHEGLVPEFECYEACSSAWTGIVSDSLRTLISTITPNLLRDRVVLITGANRGIGRALVEEALSRGAKRVYAGTRSPWTHPDPRVVPLTLDVTNAGQISEAVARVGSLDILINNAGVAHYDDLSDRAMLSRHFDVNLFGPFDLTQAFLPELVRSHGAVVNILSILALAPFPPIASYSVSKAAAFSMTQSLRAYLAGKGVKVHAVLTGPVDTDMNKGLDIPKATPAAAAKAIFDGVEEGQEEIFPDEMSAAMAEAWRRGPVKAMERQNAAFVAVQG